MNTYESISLVGSLSSEYEAEERTGLTGWSELVVSGYGFENTPENAEEQFSLEFSEAKEPVLTVVHKNGIVIASIVLDRRSEYGEETGGFSVHGVVVRPEFKKLGLGKYLYDMALQEHDVRIVVGSTKNPAAALARARSGVLHDMRTFYGMQEITSEDECGFSIDHLPILEVYYKNSSGEIDSENGLIYKPTNVLPPNVPEVGTFPVHIQMGFEHVIKAQLEVGNIKTATAPLLSIKRETLDF